MTKNDALERLSEPGLDQQEIALRVMSAVEHGATVAEIAAHFERPVDEISRVYAPAIAEAGRLGQFKHPLQPTPVARDVPDQLYVEDET